MKSKPAPITSLDQLETSVRMALERHQFKEAIGFYKDLLKRERRPEWEQGLAGAYRERALQVAGKGMFQEAVVLWENHAKLSPQTVYSDAYAGWLLRAGQFNKLADLLAKTPVELLQSLFGRRLLEAFSLLALQNDKLLLPLPAEHPIVKHHAIARQAINAYAAGNDGIIDEIIRQIPSRSPYRNVRTLLKALSLVEKDRASASQLLEKIDEDSLCEPFALVLRQQIDLLGPKPSIFFGLTPKQQSFINKFNAYGKAQLNLLKDAKKFINSQSQKIAFETVLDHRTLLGEAASRRYCLAALVEYPSGTVSYERGFGKLSEFDRQRILALNAETQRDYYTAVDRWHEATDALARRPAQKRDPLDEALIHRHIADLSHVPEPEIAVKALEKSLALDPDDKASYSSLVRLYEEIEEPKAAQEWLEKGLKRFPRDVELLQSAMNAASRRKAFKRAATLARNLLEIDPINTHARQFLIDAHIGHARKQFRAGRIDLARQELEQARPLDPHRRNAALSMLEGLLAHAAQDEECAAGLLAEGWRIAGGGICAQFLSNFETLCLDLPLSKTARLMPVLDKNHVAKRQELLGLIKLIDSSAGEKKRLSDALEKLRPTLKKSYKQAELSEDDFFNLCQSFARSAQYVSLGDCALEASKRFHSAAAPVYFAVFASCKGVAKRLSPMDERHLELALDRAHRGKDHRIAVMIENFFQQLDESLDEDFVEGLPHLPFGGNDMDPRTMVELMKRMLEIPKISREEMIRRISRAQPGLPLKGMPDDSLMDMMLLITMEELGLDAGEMMPNLFPTQGPGKKSSKFR